MLLRAGLRRSGTPHACPIFPGEGHVFHQADTISRALEAELSFYGQVLGFEPPGTSRLPRTVDRINAVGDVTFPRLPPVRGAG
jgi:hypothetical protein